MCFHRISQIKQMPFCPWIWLSILHPALDCIAFCWPDPNLSGFSRKYVSKNFQSLDREFFCAQKHRSVINNSWSVLYVFDKSSKAPRAVRSEIILNFQFCYQISLFLLDKECTYSLNHHPSSSPGGLLCNKPPGPTNQDYCTNMCRNLPACYLPIIPSTIEYFCNSLSYAALRKVY